jgi:hypothetical protein
MNESQAYVNVMVNIKIKTWKRERYVWARHRYMIYLGIVDDQVRRNNSILPVYHELVIVEARIVTPVGWKQTKVSHDILNGPMGVTWLSDHLVIKCKRHDYRN